MNRLSLDSALLRKNPFARANASNLSISTENPSPADIEPGLKSAPPVSDQQKRHSATFPLADRLLASFSSVSLSSSNDDTPAMAAEQATGVGCEVSDDEMQALLEHVRRSENERARAEHELQRREKELARVKNELRKAEREIDELRARLRRHEQHRGALDGTLNPDELGVLPPPTSRHDSLDPNHTRAGSGGGGCNAAAPASIPPVGESPYYVSNEVYGASTSTMDLSPTTAASANNANNAKPSLRPLSCSAALPPRFGNGSSPRLQTQPSMTSISEAVPQHPASTSANNSPIERSNHQVEEAEEEPQPYQYQYPPPSYQFPPPHQESSGGVGAAAATDERNGEIAAAAAALEGNNNNTSSKGHSSSGRRFLRSRHGKDKSTSATASPRPKSSYAGGSDGQQIKEKKSAGRLREKFSRMSLFGGAAGKKDDGGAGGAGGPPPSPVPAVPAMEA
ncbi:hypothetical protein UCDDS831_g00678 [Diplodia seriata]|uniref:Uncharacterized protein n=1 Tax=Diplodia seriata TaxID=420778 RepID=A0A0G2F0D0_9PEZI|nr:hypothetical protein UCDDS831_g00678 [Diplodia seriata]